MKKVGVARTPSFPALSFAVAVRISVRPEE
jgi:hypothetical protein